MGRSDSMRNSWRHILVVFSMGLLLSTQAASGGGPAGASLAFTSDDPLVVRVRDLMMEGRLEAAERLLAETPAAHSPVVARARLEAAEILRRYRREYSLELDELVARVRRSVPDVTAEDIERWRAEGCVQWRLIDGEVGYFRREPSNIFRFCEEARRRRDEHRPAPPAAPEGDAAATSPVDTTTPGPNWKLVDHLAEVVAEAQRTGQAEVLPVHHRIQYKLTVRPNRPGASAGSLVRCWLPFPQEYRQQRGVRLIRTLPAEHVVAPNVIDGHPLRGAPQRTVYLEQRIADPAEPVRFELEFEYVVSAWYPQPRDDQARPLPADWAGGNLEERPPHIVFSPELKRTVADVVGEETNPLAKARKIFLFVEREIRYAAEEEYTVIPSFSMKALTQRKGDCGVQAMLFITMCRAAGIPSRWQSGWETKPVGWNMHDWAEFYVEPWGWLPADVSYGLQASDDPRVREFFFGNIDTYRLIGNLDYGSELHPPKQSLRSEPADFQRGEVEIDGRNLYFDEWTYEISFEWKPLKNL